MTANAGPRLAALTPERRRLLEARMGTAPPPGREVRFSLFFFSSDEDPADRDKYRLILDAAAYADAHGLEAVWTPERHFHSFGGLYPAPSVLAAAIAARTETIGVRAGSVVLPLHHPVRVAEEWSVIDNLSGGRVGVSFASGWSPRDFVFAPEKYEHRKEALFDDVDLVRRLWRGETVECPGGAGPAEVAVRPLPLQPELPVWISSVGGRDTCERAGAIGANLLTALLRQSVGDARQNIAAYRGARAAAGHDPETGRVTVMMHTHLAADRDEAHEAVREPMTAYLSTYLDLMRDLAPQMGLRVDLDSLSGSERAALAEHALDRYLSSNGLFGSPESVRPLVASLQEAGVDEIACLLDFGLDADRVLAGLEHIVALRDALQAAR